MKIASVTFYDFEKGCGGASTAAISFGDWATIEGHDCSILSNPNPSDLLQYDAIFFSDPPRSHNLFNYNDISVPFILMIHAEDDLRRYPCFPDMASNEFCKAVVTIDYTGTWYDEYHETILPWYPCCRPRYLTSQIRPNSAEKVLCAGRVIEWKNTHLYQSCFPSEQIFGRIDETAYGTDYSISVVPYNIDSPVFDFLDYDLFWSVCGTPNIPVQIKRLDLAAIEAFSNGLLPIVNKDSIPSWLRGKFIEVDPDKFDKRKMMFDISEYRNNKQEIWQEANMAFLHSNYSMSEVIGRVTKIFEALT